MATESNDSVLGGSTSAERRKAVLEKLNPVTMPLRYQIGLLGIVLFALLPTQLYPDQMGQPTNLLFLMMFAMSWDVVSGYAGQLSFGHAFFFAVGGYTSAILDLQHGDRAAEITDTRRVNQSAHRGIIVSHDDQQRRSPCRRAPPVGPGLPALLDGDITPINRRFGVWRPAFAGPTGRDPWIDAGAVPNRELTRI
jgi:hypothetical protein